jgi:hypothetical protein
MSRPSNRDIEKYYFDQFSAHFQLPAGEIEYSDKPDILIHGEQKLGIEMANLYLMDGSDPSSEQVQRKRRENVVQEAQTLYLRNGGRNVELTLSFDSTNPIIQVAPVASAIAALQIESSVRNVLARHYFAHIPQLDFVYYNPIEYPNPLWSVSQVNSGRNLSPVRVAQVVADKEKLLANYKKCDTYWLLLVVDFIDSAQDQELIWPEDAVSLKTSYERIIIYKPQFAQWIDVPIEHS